jgi:ribosome-associated protein
MDATRLLPDLTYQFARSGGKGGQNVNKVATKAELRFSVRDSGLLTEDERTLLLDKLASKLTSEGELVLTHQTERTQLANKDKVTQKFVRLIEKAFEQPKPRRATRPSKAAVEERRADKRQRSTVKANRRRVDSGD